MWKQSQTRACSLIMLSMKSQDICILLIGKIKLEKKTLLKWIIFYKVMHIKKHHPF